MTTKEQNDIESQVRLLQGQNLKNLAEIELLRAGIAHALSRLEKCEAELKRA